MPLKPDVRCALTLMSRLAVASVRSSRSPSRRARRRPTRGRCPHRSGRRPPRRRCRARRALARGRPSRDRGRARGRRTRRERLRQRLVLRPARPDARRRRYGAGERARGPVRRRRGSSAPASVGRASIVAGRRRVRPYRAGRCVSRRAAWARPGGHARRAGDDGRERQGRRRCRVPGLPRRGLHEGARLPGGAQGRHVDVPLDAARRRVGAAAPGRGGDQRPRGRDGGLDAGEHAVRPHPHGGRDRAAAPARRSGDPRDSTSRRRRC